MIEHALWLASNGLSVFPLAVGTKEPLPGSHGFKDATRDADQIRRWWGRNPGLNIGIRTGAESGITVIDTDGPEAEASLRGMGEIPPTLTVKTGKGFHYYFAYESGSTIGQSQIGPGIDHRNDLGYVVAPPSVHPSGAVYAWHDMSPLAPLPEFLSARLRAISAAKAAPMLAPALALAAPATVDTARVSLSLEGHEQAVTNAAPGTKHQTLVNAAWAHACAAHEGHEPRETAEPRVTQRLLAALTMNTKSPVDSWANAGAAVRSAFDQAYARPLPVRLTSNENEFNEDSFARRFAKLYGPDATGADAKPSVLFVPGQGWRLWDGKRWAEQPGSGRPTELVAEMLSAVAGTVEDEKLRGQVKAKKSAGTIGSILTLAQRYTTVPYNALDSDTFLLNCQNGTLDLRTGQLKPHNPADLLTKCAGVSFDPYARCDAWLAALSQMHNHDRHTLEYLRLLLGSFLQGDPIDGFWLMYGNGFDGKTTVLRVLLGVLGEYAAAATPGSITISRNGSTPHTSAIGGLAGKRLAMIDELPSDCQLDTGAIKRLFGATPLRVQTGMGKDFVDVRPTAKGLAASNHLPRVDENDFGTKRRLFVIPFDADLKSQGVQKDDTFAPRLVAHEGPGILAWLVSGCLSWQAQGRAVTAPSRVRLATDELFGEADIIGAFVDSCCLVGTSLEVSAAVLYGAYKGFAETQGDYVCSKKTFGSRLRERGYSPTRIQSDKEQIRGYKGLLLKSPPQPLPDTATATRGNPAPR